MRVTWILFSQESLQGFGLCLSGHFPHSLVSNLSYPFAFQFHVLGDVCHGDVRAPYAVELAYYFALALIEYFDGCLEVF